MLFPFLVFLASFPLFLDGVSLLFKFLTGRRRLGEMGRYGLESEVLDRVVRRQGGSGSEQGFASLGPGLRWMA